MMSSMKSFLVYVGLPPLSAQALRYRFRTVSSYSDEHLKRSFILDLHRYMIRRKYEERSIICDSDESYEEKYR